MARAKYVSVKQEYSKYVDLPVEELEGLVRSDSSMLERTDYKDICLELCQRIKEMTKCSG